MILCCIWCSRVDLWSFKEFKLLGRGIDIIFCWLEKVSSAVLIQFTVQTVTSYFGENS